MKKLKLLWLLWLFSLIWLNFSSAWLVRSNDIPINSTAWTSFNGVLNLPYNWTWSSFVCFNPYYDDIDWVTFEEYTYIGVFSDWPNPSVLDIGSSPYFGFSYPICWLISDSSLSYNYSVNTFYSAWVNSLSYFQVYNSDSSSSCDYSQYESQISSLSWSLASCQSSLSSCQSQLPSGWSCKVSNFNSLAYTWELTLTANSTTNIIDFNSSPNKTMCITLNGDLWNQNYLKLWFNNNKTAVASDSQEYWYDQTWKTVCLYANKRYFNINNPKATTPTITYQIYFLNDLLNKSVPCEEWFLWYTQSQCESEYNLIPISSITQSYCVSNNLCPTIPDNECWTWEFNDWSALWINNIQHLGASNIFINIPEEISWDYAYTNNDNNMNIDIEWYNVDYDYINWVVDLQKYTPTSEDFTNIVSNLWSYFKILLFLVFAFLIIRWIKNIFKSKKL